MSARAIETLQSVDYILCEDTRRAHKLKAHFSLTAPLISFHEHNEQKRIPQIVSRMQKGKTFALISDAGAPLVSDPGLGLVRELIRLEIPFTCVPGPSAVITALLLSGFTPQPFLFYGFLPVKAAERKRTLEELHQFHGCAVILFESPERVVSLVREIGERLGDRDIAICREMTKIHEDILRGKPSELLPRIVSRKLIGEFTIVIAPGEAPTSEMSEESIRARFEQLLKEGSSRKDALKKLAKESGRSRNDLYALLLK